MMKTFGLVLALILVIAGGAFADTAVIDVYPGWNLVSAPLVPFNPKPGNPDFTDPGVFSSGADVDFIDALSRWDAPSQGWIGYLFYDPASFGNVLLGDGYQLYHDPNTYSAGQITYEGVPDGVPDAQNNMTDMWISLPGNQNDGVDAGGWQLIGQPYAHATDFNEVEYSWDGANIKVTDGTEVKTLIDAASAGWIDEPFQYLDAVSQGFKTAGYGSFVYDDDCLRPGKAYWVKTNRDNLALIIPATIANH